VWPWLQQLNGQQLPRSNNLVTGLPQAAGPLGGVQAFCLQPGSSLNISSSLSLGAITLDPSYTQGSGRLLGLGFEVINTTSDLNRQGTVTVWRQEQALQGIGVVGFLNATALPIQLKAQETAFYRPPPFSVANAMLYPGSRQWKAADGAYVVTTFTASENPPTFVSYVQPGVSIQTVDDIESSNAAPAAFNNIRLWSPTPLTDGVYAQVSPAIRLHPINMSGAMFTGLSTATTLTLNVNIYYESFPSVAEQGILVLAKPSAAFDPVALEFMSRVNSSLPVGVPASWNPEGEWFWEIVNDLMDLAPVLGGAFGPEGAMIGKGLSYGYDKLTDRYTPEKNAERAKVRADKREERVKKVATQAAKKEVKKDERKKERQAVPAGDSRPKPSGRGRRGRR